MKQNIEKIQIGLTNFVDHEMVNQLEGWQKIAIGAGLALVIKNLPNTIKTYQAHPVMAMLGVIDENGNIDIDSLHDAVADYFTEVGEYINLPLVGRMKVTRKDIETLYKYLKEA